MDAEAFVVSVEKKLKSNWTSWTITNLLTANNIDEVKYNFDKFDKKTKMKVLIALINIESNQKTLAAASIKRLLKHASEDNDEWVSVVAGLVHGKLFQTDDPLIQQNLHQILNTTTNKVIDHLSRNDLNENILSLFQPLENEYVSSVPCPVNIHCTYVGKAPNFMQAASKDTPSTTTSSTDRHIPPPSLMPSITKRPVVAPERSSSDTATSRPHSTTSFGINKERKTKAVSIEQIMKLKQEQIAKEKAEKAAATKRSASQVSKKETSIDTKKEAVENDREDEEVVKRQKQNHVDATHVESGQ